MEDYGADGMRFGLLMQVTGAQDLKFNEAKLESSRNFANKIRNAARFVMMNLDGYEPGEPAPSTPADRWIFSRLAGLVARLDAAFDGFEFGEAHARAVRVLLERVLRLVHRVLEGAPGRWGRPRRTAWRASATSCSCSTRRCGCYIPSCRS